MIDPQKPGEEKKYNIILNNLGNYPKGEYRSYYWLYINDKIIGEKLTLRINIKEENKIENEIAQNMEKIKEFIDNYGFLEYEYSNEKILEVLKASNFDFELSFNKLFE